MESVKEYFLSLIVVVISAGLINVFAPEGKSKIGKYVKYIVSLAVLLVICIPIKPAIEFVMSFANEEIDIESYVKKEYGQYVQETNKLILDNESKKISEGLKEALNGKFEIPEHECEIEIEYDTSEGANVKIKCINIFLSGYSLWKNPREIEEYIYELIGREYEVNVR